MSQSDQQRQVNLPAGTIHYREAGEGKPVVFVHGYLANSRLWDGVVDHLSDSCRCLAPDWPLASHQEAMNRDADLTPYGIAKIIADFLEKLDLQDVTIVGNDSGTAASQVLATRHPERIGRLVLTNGDSHSNFPPPGFKALPVIARLPRGMRLIVGPLRIGPFARKAFKPLSKNPIPPDVLSSWIDPCFKDVDVRRDGKKVTIGMNKRYTLEAAEKLHEFKGPILLAWAPEDKVFPLKYAQQLASEASNAGIVEIPDSLAFVPMDQPRRLAKEIASFVSS